MNKNKLNFGKKNMNKHYNKSPFNIKIKDMISMVSKDHQVVIYVQPVVINVLQVIIKDQLVETDKGTLFHKIYLFHYFYSHFSLLFKIFLKKYL